jgi:hypothetical protein
MKRNLFVVYTCIVTIVCFALIGYIGVINHDYEIDLQTLWRNYRSENVELLNENSILSRRVAELEKQIWNIVNGKDYNVTVGHNGDTYTYVREYDDLGITSIVTNYITH